MEIDKEIPIMVGDFPELADVKDGQLLEILAAGHAIHEAAKNGENLPQKIIDGFLHISMGMFIKEAMKRGISEFCYGADGVCHVKREESS